MTGPVVLTGNDLDGVEHVRRMLDALRGARSWTCDRKSQIPCLRFVDADGQDRIVAMEAAVIHPDDPGCRLDGHPRVADALRDAAIVCLRRAILPVDMGQVSEACERLKAYAVTVAAQTDHGDVSDGCMIVAASPWRPPGVRVFHSPHGMPVLKDTVDAPDPDLCPVMFGVTEGDSGAMRSMSIGLSITHEGVGRRPDMMEALRAGEMLRHPWRNA